MFEYQILRADGFVSVEQLNSLGADGWELVSLIADEEGYDYIFKRFIGLGNRPSVFSTQRFQPKNLPPTMTEVMKVFENVD